jgi:tetratricopeptide (TPR) repeat protein
MMTLASLLAMQHRLDEAASLYARCREVPDLRREALLQEAKCRRMLAQPAEARRCLDELLAAAPQSASAWCELGRLEISLGKYQKAQEHLRAAERYDPRGPEIRRHLAAVRSLLKTNH